MNSCEEIMKMYSWEEKTVEEYVVDTVEEALDIVGHYYSVKYRTPLIKTNSLSGCSLQ